MMTFIEADAVKERLDIRLIAEPAVPQASLQRGIDATFVEAIPKVCLIGSGEPLSAKKADLVEQAGKVVNALNLFTWTAEILHLHDCGIQRASRKCNKPQRLCFDTKLKDSAPPRL
jgi:hypothetical protein